MHEYLIFSTLFIMTAVAFATSRDDEVLAQAERLQLEFRQGNVEAVKPLVSTLEGAVKESSANAKLWEAMGNAYMSQLGSLFAAQTDKNTLLATGERGRDAYARSLALNGSDPLVQANHGMSQMVVSQLKGDGPGMTAGIEEMNAAVRRSPRNTGVRLTRGFTIVHLPPALRDNTAVTEDLQYALDAAAGGRAEDVLHIMLGDVLAELGDMKAARREYSQVSGASTFAAEQAKLRMRKDTIPAELISAVRIGTGTRCAMCHAPGTDD